MNLVDKMKLVEMYGEYKSERVAKSNRELYNSLVSTLAKEMRRIKDTGSAIDYIDHLAEELRWSCIDHGDVRYAFREFLNFYR